MSKVNLAVAKPNERGSSLLIVVVVLMVVLVGGLATVAVTNGQLSKARGFRTMAVDDACAEAGLAQMRAQLPNIPDFAATDGTVTVGSKTLDYRAGHYDGDGENPYEVLDPSEFDGSSVFVGENISNVLGSGGTDLSTGVHMVRMTSVCGGIGYGKREVEMLFKYGVPVSAR